MTDKTITLADGRTLPDVAYRAADAYSFGLAFEFARQASRQIHDATSTFTHEHGTFYVLAHDNRSGFALREDGELVFVFSLVKGRGDQLVAAAVTWGALYLDCFDGYLPTLYARHGFEQVKRVPNWTPGGPDVVYMAQPGYAHRHGVES